MEENGKLKNMNMLAGDLSLRSRLINFFDFLTLGLNTEVLSDILEHVDIIVIATDEEEEILRVPFKPLLSAYKNSDNYRRRIVLSLEEKDQLIYMITLHLLHDKRLNKTTSILIDKNKAWTEFFTVEYGKLHSD